VRCLALLAIAGCSFGLPSSPSRERTSVEEQVSCQDIYTRPVLDSIGLLASVAATIAIFKYKDECYAVDCLFLPYALVGSLVYPLAAVHGFSSVSKCRSMKRRVARERVEEEARAARERARGDAWTITKQAAAAARADRCDEVRVASVKVREIDEEFHALVFRRDVAIARCLGDAK
jgi:hypothetical protein